MLMKAGRGEGLSHGKDNADRESSEKRASTVEGRFDTLMSSCCYGHKHVFHCCASQNDLKSAGESDFFPTRANKIVSRPCFIYSPFHTFTIPVYLVEININ